MANQTNPEPDLRRRDDPSRPAYRFTPPVGWMNDPNGLVHFDGEFHLFYQYNPHAPDFGAMHWGHAVSTDLVRWEHLPPALAPDELGLIYSGCVVVDWRNTSGFGRDGAPPLIALFTYHSTARERLGVGDHQTQAIAYSLDRGRTWRKYEGNPVLPNLEKKPDFRDPKVIWVADIGRWIMVLAVGDHVEFYASRDLKEWRYLSAFGAGLGAKGVWECPDLFPLAVDDVNEADSEIRGESSGESKWALIVSVNPGGPQGGSGAQYFIGGFDGERFVLDEDWAAAQPVSGAAWLDWGADNYAGVTWSDVPQADGRRLFIGWMSNWRYAQHTPRRAWRGAMTTPRELSLRRAGDGTALTARPVREVERCMTTVRRWRAGEGASTPPKLRTEFAPGEVRIAAAPVRGAAVSFGVELSNANGERCRIGFDAAEDVFFCEAPSFGDPSIVGGAPPFEPVRRAVMPRGTVGETMALQVLIDIGSAELFVDDGAASMTTALFPQFPFEAVAVFIEGRGANIATASIARFEAGL